MCGCVCFSLSFINLLLWSHGDNWNLTRCEWGLDGPLKSLFCFLLIGSTQRRDPNVSKRGLGVLNLLLCNHWANCNQTWYECLLDSSYEVFLVDQYRKYTKETRYPKAQLAFSDRRFWHLCIRMLQAFHIFLFFRPTACPCQPPLCFCTVGQLNTIQDQKETHLDTTRLLLLLTIEAN